MIDISVFVRFSEHRIHDKSKNTKKYKFSSRGVRVASNESVTEDSMIAS